MRDGYITRLTVSDDIEVRAYFRRILQNELNVIHVISYVYFKIGILQDFVIL